MEPVDPWYDYLAFPVAPLVLALQVAALTFGPRRRLAFVGAGSAVIAALFVLVAFLLPQGEGANIGAGLLLLQLLASLGVLGLALLISVGQALWARRRARALKLEESRSAEKA